MSTLTKLLDDYRNAVRRAAYWEDHGTYGDGKDTETQAAEKAARKALRTALTTKEKD